MALPPKVSVKIHDQGSTGSSFGYATETAMAVLQRLNPLDPQKVINIGAAIRRGRRKAVAKRT